MEELILRSGLHESDVKKGVEQLINAGLLVKNEQKLRFNSEFSYKTGQLLVSDFDKTNYFADNCIPNTNEQEQKLEEY